MAPPWAPVSRSCSRRSPPPQRWPEEQGGGEAREARGRGARGVRWPAGTDDTSPGDTASTTACGRRVYGQVLLGSRAVWCRRWSRQLWRPRRRRRSTLLLCPSSWRRRWQRSSRRKWRLRSRRRWRSWRRRWLRLRTGFWSSFSGNGRSGPGSLVRPGPHSPASSSSPFTGSWSGMRWRRRRISGRRTK